MRGDGRVFAGRYRVDRELGRSPLATSFLVTDLKTSRPCVLKRLLEADVPAEDARIFEAQAAILAKLEHPGLPAFVEYLVEDQGAGREHLLVTRYYPGESLERLVAKGRLLTEAQALALLRRLTPVFKYLHDFDPPLVHRLLKASNIIVGPDARPCLVDFHFAVEGPGWRAWEGTPPDADEVPIVAPEVALAGAVPASDIYALGMALIYAISGRDPEELVSEGARARLREALQVSDAFAVILSRMVEPTTERRYMDVRTLEAELARIGAGRTPGAPSPLSARQVEPETRRSPRRPAVLAAALVLVALVGAVLWWRGTRAPQLVATAPTAGAPATAEPAAAGAPEVPEAPEAPPAGGAAATPAQVDATAPANPTAPAAAAVEPAVGAAPAVPVGAPESAGALQPAVAPAPAPNPAPSAAPAAPGDAAAVVLEGRLLFDGQSVVGASLPAPLFWFRDDARKVQVAPRVDYDAGSFKVRGLAPGRYGLSVRVDAQKSNPNIFPGDFNAWAEFTVEAGRTQALDMPLRKIIRLQQPVDNGAVLPGWDAPCGAGHPSPGKILFAWESLDPEASYEVRVDRLLCGRGYATAGAAFSRTTSDPWVNVELPPNRAGECYSFRLTAKKRGQPIGILATHGKTGLGWDYRFAVQP